MSRRNVLLVNVLSAVATLIGAALIYGLGGEIGISESVLLSITAGFFIYIAASDIIPTIHAEPERKWANIQTIVLILGIVLVGAAAQLAHQLVPHETDSESKKHTAEEAHHDE